jgi:hypothetical protein
MTRTAITPRIAARRITVGFFALLTLTSGCGLLHHDPLIGKWSKSLSAGGQSIVVAFAYKADGTGAQSMSIPGHTENMAFTYTHTGDALKQTVTGVTLDGKTLPAAAAGTHPMEFTTHIEGDKLTLTPKGSGQAQVFTKQP